MRRLTGRESSVFDGVCNGSVSFILQREKEAVFNFASIQSGAGQELLELFGKRACCVIPTEALKARFFMKTWRRLPPRFTRSRLCHDNPDYPHTRNTSSPHSFPLDETAGPSSCRKRGTWGQNLFSLSRGVDLSLSL